MVSVLHLGSQKGKESGQADATKSLIAFSDAKKAISGFRSVADAEAFFGNKATGLELVDSTKERVIAFHGQEQFITYWKIEDLQGDQCYDRLARNGLRIDQKTSKTLVMDYIKFFGNVESLNFMDEKTAQAIELYFLSIDSGMNMVAMRCPSVVFRDSNHKLVYSKNFGPYYPLAFIDQEYQGLHSFDMYNPFKSGPADMKYAFIPNKDFSAKNGYIGTFIEFIEVSPIRQKSIVVYGLKNFFGRFNVAVNMFDNGALNGYSSSMLSSFYAVFELFTMPGTSSEDYDLDKIMKSAVISSYVFGSENDMMVFSLASQNLKGTAFGKKVIMYPRSGDKRLWEAIGETVNPASTEIRIFKGRDFATVVTKTQKGMHIEVCKFTDAGFDEKSYASFVIKG